MTWFGDSDFYIHNSRLSTETTLLRRKNTNLTVWIQYWQRSHWKGIRIQACGRLLLTLTLWVYSHRAYAETCGVSSLVRDMPINWILCRLKCITFILIPGKKCDGTLKTIWHWFFFLLFGRCFDCIMILWSYVNQVCENKFWINNLVCWYLENLVRLADIYLLWNVLTDSKRF